jgi:short-subunit dehydrogenase
MTILDKKTGEIHEGNPPFFQFKKHNFKMIRKLMDENIIASKMLMFLIENMNEITNSLIVSQESLSEVLECGRTSIYNATKHLVDGKYIQLLKSGVNNVYCVNADIVWTKRADQIFHARFNTSVYLTSTEQDEEQKLEIKKRFEKIIEIDKVKKTKFEPEESFK